MTWGQESYQVCHVTDTIGHNRRPDNALPDPTFRHPLFLHILLHDIPDAPIQYHALSVLQHHRMRAMMGGSAFESLDAHAVEILNIESVRVKRLPHRSPRYGHVP